MAATMTGGSVSVVKRIAVGVPPHRADVSNASAAVEPLTDSGIFGIAPEDSVAGGMSLSLESDGGASSGAAPADGVIPHRFRIRVETR
ncbi:MAG: hypothetical protein NT069_20430 [Planctomycetota bacterium]|nr:hypothetical protein [Planctomycetota bacterium]